MLHTQLPEPPTISGNLSRAPSLRLLSWVGVLDTQQPNLYLTLCYLLSDPGDTGRLAFLYFLFEHGPRSSQGEPQTQPFLEIRMEHLPFPRSREFVSFHLWAPGRPGPCETLMPFVSYQERRHFFLRFCLGPVEGWGGALSRENTTSWELSVQPALPVRSGGALEPCCSLQEGFFPASSRSSRKQGCNSRVHSSQQQRRPGGIRSPGEALTHLY